VPTSAAAAAVPSSTRAKPKSTLPGQVQNTILSLSAAHIPSASKLALERRAAQQVRRNKEEREDKARVKDVIEGWAPDATLGPIGAQEFERSLRKTAQRGGMLCLYKTQTRLPLRRTSKRCSTSNVPVIKLFNAIIAASKANEEAETDQPLHVRAGIKNEPKSKKEKDNLLGRAGKEGLTKESFLDMVRHG
jgi:hypothetical protein